MQKSVASERLSPFKAFVPSLPADLSALLPNSGAASAEFASHQVDLTHARTILASEDVFGARSLTANAFASS